jgi:hypothetical protein
VDVKSIIGANVDVAAGVTVGQKSGTAEACNKDSQDPIVDCAAPLAISLAPLQQGDCIVTLDNQVALGEGSSKTVGECKMDGDVDVFVNGSVTANCDHSNQDWCNSPPEWYFAIDVAGRKLPVQRKGANNPDKPRAHVWALAGYVAGSGVKYSGEPIRLVSDHCWVANSMDKTCYFPKGMEIRIHRR